MKQVLLSSVALLFAASAACGQPVEVRTTLGVLQGTDESGVKVFKGVPYAAPPVGALRWRAPQPPQAWQGVRPATDYGPDPMQEPLYGDMRFGAARKSEDCLYLNIWTPAKTMTEHLPVLIYFNGGGLIAGSGSEPRYAGAAMARRGVVTVTANYREGIFGFFAHPQLSAETDYKGSGNYGFMDQAAAIAWVRHNIEAFGGDSSRITIMGESAGSMSVSVLMASPRSRTLFAQAMGSSGSAMAFAPAVTLREAERAGERKMRAMGCRSIKELRELPAEELLRRAAVRSIPPVVVDGCFMPEQPMDIYCRGEQAKVPLLVGRNTAESTADYLLRGQEPSVENVRTALRTLMGDSTDRVLALYGIDSDDAVKGDAGTALGSDVFIAFGTWRWWNLHLHTSGQPVYRYLYGRARPAKRVGDARTPPQGERGAVHSADIEYAMGNLPTNRVFDWQPEDYVVSDQMAGYYANFVKTGNPNGPGLAEWPVSDGTETTPVLYIDTRSTVKTDVTAERRYRYLDGLFQW